MIVPTVALPPHEMKPKLRNFFFILGLASILWMLISFPFSWQEVVNGAYRAGVWLPVIILLWLPIYIINTCAWRILLQSTAEERDAPLPPLWYMYKLTVTGFALNYVTPVGLLGGEPYRILELQNYVGSVRASSSTILHTMMHIFSHFCFWGFSIILFLYLYAAQMKTTPLLIVAGCGCFCLLGIYIFTLGYRYGLAQRLLTTLSHWPFIGPRIKVFRTNKQEQIEHIDKQIACLHNSHPYIFYGSLCLEFLARMIGCLEVYLILYLLNPSASYWDAVLIQAFTSLFANLVFFIPMQLGAREGGMAWSSSALQLGTFYGFFLSLFIRLRELFWICIGLLLIRLGNKKMIWTEKKIHPHSNMP